MAQAMALTKEGYYHVFSGFYKIQRSPKTGNEYAKKFNPDTQSWEFAKGAVNKLRPEFKMSVEQAKAFGNLYGRCMVCSHVLTDEKSISAGIGPICAEKF